MKIVSCELATFWHGSKTYDGDSPSHGGKSHSGEEHDDEDNPANEV